MVVIILRIPETFLEKSANKGSDIICFVLVSAVSRSGAPTQTKWENSAYFPTMGYAKPNELFSNPNFFANLGVKLLNSAK